MGPTGSLYCPTVQSITQQFTGSKTFDCALVSTLDTSATARDRALAALRARHASEWGAAATADSPAGRVALATTQAAEVDACHNNLLEEDAEAFSALKASTEEVMQRVRFAACEVLFHAFISFTSQSINALAPFTSCRFHRPLRTRRLSSRKRRSTSRTSPQSCPRSMRADTRRPEMQRLLSARKLLLRSRLRIDRNSNALVGAPTMPICLLDTVRGISLTDSDAFPTRPYLLYLPLFALQLLPSLQLWLLAMSALRLTAVPSTQPLCVLEPLFHSLSWRRACGAITPITTHGRTRYERCSLWSGRSSRVTA